MMVFRMRMILRRLSIIVVVVVFGLASADFRIRGQTYCRDSVIGARSPARRN
jgi:hypothetical protein